MKPLTSYTAELARNPSARKGVEYGPVQEHVLNAEGLNVAKNIISAWPNYKPTPLINLRGLAKAANVKSLHYKDEAFRFELKSFKPLGGAYAVARMLIRELPKIIGNKNISINDLLSGHYKAAVSTFTVTAATDGNHGRSVAWGARMFGCRSVIFINEAVSTGREKAIASYGAEVRRNPGSYDDAVRKAQTTAEIEGWHVIADTSSDITDQAPRDVTQGYAVMAVETIDQLPYNEAPTHIFLQAGVGGMAAATCAQFWQEFGTSRPETILVEPVNAACWFASLKAGHPVIIDGDLDSLMGGLSCGEISRLAWEVLKTGTDAMMKIEDVAAADCMRLLAKSPYGDPKIIAGESGVAGLAGFLAAAQNNRMRQALQLDENSRVVIFGTEGATDPVTYAKIVDQTTERLT